MLRKIDRLILRVPSLPSAVTYYRDVVGLKLVRQEKQVASFRLSDDTTELVLHTDAELPAEAVYYLVDDVRRHMYRRRRRIKVDVRGAAHSGGAGTAAGEGPVRLGLLLLDRTTERNKSGAAAGTTVVEDAKESETLFAGFEPFRRAKPEVLCAVRKDRPHRRRPALHAALREPLQCLRRPLRHRPADAAGSVAAPAQYPQARQTPRSSARRSKPPKVTEEALARICAQMLGADIGKRDRLPYTKRFGELVDEFNKSQDRPLSPHLVWRLVATLAK